MILLKNKDPNKVEIYGCTASDDTVYLCVFDSIKKAEEFRYEKDLGDDWEVFSHPFWVYSFLYEYRDRFDNITMNPKPQDGGTFTVHSLEKVLARMASLN